MEVWQSWSIAPVLKTGVPQGTGGSNPSASAKCIFTHKKPSSFWAFLFLMFSWFPSGLPVFIYMWAIEEPLMPLRFEGLLEFSTLLDCQVILDEAVCNVDQLLPFLQHPDRFLLNLRISKCRGLLQASEMATTCIDAGVAPF